MAGNPSAPSSVEASDGADRRLDRRACERDPRAIVPGFGDTAEANRPAPFLGQQGAPSWRRACRRTCTGSVRASTGHMSLALARSSQTIADPCRTVCRGLGVAPLQLPRARPRVMELIARPRSQLLKNAIDRSCIRSIEGVCWPFDPECGQRPCRRAESATPRLTGDENSYSRAANALWSTLSAPNDYDKLSFAFRNVQLRFWILPPKDAEALGGDAPPEAKKGVFAVP